MSEKEICWPIA